jgi:hypothetical protein
MIFLSYFFFFPEHYNSLAALELRNSSTGGEPTL